MICFDASGIDPNVAHRPTALQESFTSICLSIFPPMQSSPQMRQDFHVRGPHVLCRNCQKSVSVHMSSPIFQAPSLCQITLPRMIQSHYLLCNTLTRQTHRQPGLHPHRAKLQLPIEDQSLIRLQVASRLYFASVFSFGRHSYLRMRLQESMRIILDFPVLLRRWKR